MRLSEPWAGSDSYLICATPRSGSTLLCGLLRSTGVAGRPDSYFRLPDEASWAHRWRIARDPGETFDYQDYVRAALAEGTTDNGVFGARIMWGTMEEVVAKLGVVHPGLAGDDLGLLTRAFGRTRFVHLWRDDTVAQAVSWALAEQTNCWQEHNAAWRDWFAAFDIRPHLVRHEELTVDMVSVTHGIVESLGLELPGDRMIVAGHRRRVEAIKDAWIVRYHAITERGH